MSRRIEEVSNDSGNGLKGNKDLIVSHLVGTLAVGETEKQNAFYGTFGVTFNRTLKWTK